jgi:hypothetical protein
VGARDPRGTRHASTLFADHTQKGIALIVNILVTESARSLRALNRKIHNQPITKLHKPSAAVKEFLQVRSTVKKLQADIEKLSKQLESHEKFNASLSNNHQTVKLVSVPTRTKVATI